MNPEKMREDSTVDAHVQNLVVYLAGKMVVKPIAAY